MKGLCSLKEEIKTVAFIHFKQSPVLAEFLSTSVEREAAEGGSGGGFEV